MDYVEIPDLWERSFAYLTGWVKKIILRLPVELEATTRRVRRIFLTYTLSSIAYKILLVTLFLLFLKNFLVSQFGPIGYLLLGLLILLAFRKYIMRSWSVLKFSLLDKKEVLMSPKSFVVFGVVSGALLLGTTVPPVPVSIGGTFVLEPRSRTLVRASEEGVIERILIGEGQEVRQGEPLAVLRNEDLTRHLRSQRQELELIERDIAEASGKAEKGALAKSMNKRDQLRHEIRTLSSRVSELILRSSIEGTVMTPRLEDRLGAHLAIGDLFCEISRPDDLIARVPIHEYRLNQIQGGQRADLILLSFPFRTFRGRVVAPAPASREEKIEVGSFPSDTGAPRREDANFDVIVEFLDRADSLKAGMSGNARIRLGRATIATRTGRALRRWFGSTVW
jgi:hypothetical protein